MKEFLSTLTTILVLAFLYFEKLIIEDINDQYKRQSARDKSDKEFLTIKNEALR